MTDTLYGFRIVGATSEPRRLVDAGAAFAGYAACDDRAEVQREGYLSAFWYGGDFRHHLADTGSTAGYSGPCWSPWLWFDLDNPEDLGHAQADAGALVDFLVERFAVDPGDLLIFFSGSKGFHIGLPTCLWAPSPSVDFHRIARKFAERLSGLASVTIDVGVYDKVRAFRAPNSRHTKTSLHKRRLTFDELLGPLNAILELAAKPAPFDVPAPTGSNGTAAADWQAATTVVEEEAEAKVARRAAGTGSPTLNRSTLSFIREGAATGDRHRLLFSAAANLGEFDCPPALAEALLAEPALDSGLAPRDVRRQIECGLAAAGTPAHQDRPEVPPAARNGSIVKRATEVAMGDAGSSEGQSCQQVTRATEPAPVAGLQAALAKLWQSSPAAKTDQGEALPLPALDGGSSTAMLPPLPPALTPLPSRAVGRAMLDTPCRCGSTEGVDIAVSPHQTRRDCGKCGRFIAWAKWETGGPTE